eukprot:450868_1
MSNGSPSTTFKTSYGSLPSITHKSTSFRWWVYSACGLVMFSTWYSYFIPSGLQTQFISDYNLSNDEYAFLFSIATGPTFIVPIFAGIMVDKTGLGLPLIISCLLSTIAQIIFLSALILDDKLIMYISRCILGIGACCWGCTMNSMLAKYFVDNELAFALSLSPSATRAGFIAADYLSYSIYYLTGEKTVIWAVLCNLMFLLLSLIAIIIVVIVHKKKQKQRTKHLLLNIKQSRLLKKTFSDSFIKVGKDMGVIPVSLWLLIFIAGVGFVPFVCFTVIGSDLFQNTYGYDEGFSDRLMVLPCFVAVIFSPLVGIFLDKFGKLTDILAMSSILYMVFHLYVIYGVGEEVVMVIMLCVLGIAFPMYAASMWSAVALIADPSVIGTAYALCYMSYALWNALAQYVAGRLTIEINGVADYYYVEVFFVFIALLMFICAVILLVYDRKTTKTLYNFKKNLR